MPQLVPFYFTNQVTFTFIAVACLIYIFTKYVLPRFTRLFISRTLYNKL